MKFRPRLSFTVTIVIAFTLVFSSGLGLAVLGFRSTEEQAAVATADTRLVEVAATIAARTNSLVGPVLALIHQVAGTGIPAGPIAAAGTALPLLTMIEAEPEVRAASVGWPDGTMLQVAPVAEVAWPRGLAPPQGTAFVLRASRPGAMASWTFLTADHTPISSVAAGQSDDPRETQWYLQALDAGVHISTLYLLGVSGRPGLSISTRLADGGIVALDVTLAELGAFLRAQQITPNTLAFLFSDLGILLAYPEESRAILRSSGDRMSWTTLQASGDPLLRHIWDAYATAQLAPGRGVLLNVGGVDTLVRLAAIESLADPPVLVAVAAPRSDFTATVESSVRHGTMLALGAFLAGLAAIVLISWRIAAPLGELTREAQAIQRLELGVPLVVRSHITEVERLAEAVSAMKATLGSFAVYLPRDLLRKFLEAGTEPRLGGERVALSLMFTDVQNFTGIGETLDPMQLTRIASAYFEAVTRELLAAGATIDKYIGDAVMAFWNAPRTDPSHAEHACAGALRTRLVTLRLADTFAARDWPQLWTRFGVHTGEAVVGNVGSSDRMTYTAMGAMVNLANRLEGLNKLYGTQILVSDTTRAAASSRFVFRPIDIVIPKGTASPMPIHELLGFAPGEAPPELCARDADLASLGAWTDCVEAYRGGHFDEAGAALRAMHCTSGFRAAAIYAERLSGLGPAAPPGWSPALHLVDK